MRSRNIQFYRAQEESQTTTGYPERNSVCKKKTHKNLLEQCAGIIGKQRQEMNDESNFNPDR